MSSGPGSWFFFSSRYLRTSCSSLCVCVCVCACVVIKGLCRGFPPDDVIHVNVHSEVIVGNVPFGLH